MTGASREIISSPALFVKGHIDDVDANYLAGLLRPQYSPEGSSRKLLEEKVVDHLQDFLLSLEDDNITGYSAPMAWNYEESHLQDKVEFAAEEQFHSPDLTASGVMGWLTGQRHREMNGQKVKITVKFDHECKIRNPNHTIMLSVYRSLWDGNHFANRTHEHL